MKTLINNIKKKCVKNKVKIIFLVCTICIFAATCLAVWGAYFERSDFLEHGKWALTITKDTLINFIKEYCSYPMWHIGVKILYTLTGVSQFTAVSLCTSIFNCIAFFAVIYIWRIIDSKATIVQRIIGSTCLMFIGPLYIPWASTLYYLGPGTGNIWHNPTHITVKFFAVMSFGIILFILQKQNDAKNCWKKYLLLSIMLLLSALAKPSFLQGMIPGLGLYFLFQIIFNAKRKRNIKKYLSIMMCFIPCAVVIIFQFMLAFFTDTTVNEGGGIGISFGKVLYKYTNSISISFLIALAFPIVMLLTNYRKLIRDTSVQLAICYEICAWLESCFLYEKGERCWHGNWFWGSYISLFIIWMVFFIKYVNLYREEKLVTNKWKIILPGLVIILQLIFGFLFWCIFVMGIYKYLCQ